mgnify:CR=1 FL=1
MYFHAVTSWHIQNYIDYLKFGSLFFFCGDFFMALYRRKTFSRKMIEMALLLTNYTIGNLSCATATASVLVSIEFWPDHVEVFWV